MLRAVVFGLALTALPAMALAQKEMPGPPSDMQVVKAGSLIIAMDNDKQNIGSLFNVASYGLVVDLLNNNIPAKWAIRAGKSKDASDFTATVARIAPSAQAQATLTFSGGPFIIEKSYAALARSRISSFGRNVAVYELMADAVIDIRYDLLFKPRPFVNTTNASLVTNLLTNAGISTYTVGPDFSVQESSCYTIIMEPHNDVTTGITAISSFVATGGNFYAQCLSATSFENAGKFLSSAGFTGNNVNATLSYPNPDLSFGQFIGGVPANPGGAVQDWFLTAGSIFKAGASVHAESGSGSSLRYAALQGKTLSSSSVGGVVFYVGGHDYSGTALSDLNGQRLMFNAILTPAKRPSVCNLQPLEIPVSDITISKTHQGGYMSGTQGTFAFTIGNIGDRESLDEIVVTDTLPAGMTFASGSGSGWSFASSVIAGGRTVVVATTATTIPVNGSTTFSIDVGIGTGTVGTRVNTAHVVGGGETNLANNASSVTVSILGMSGRVFEDLGTIGVEDGADLPFAGLTVNIVNNSVTFTTTTDAQGYWSIAGLSPNTTATVTIPTSGGNAILAGATQSIGTNPSDHAAGSSGIADGGKDGFRNLHANLAVTKSGPATALVGDTIEYVITTTNSGPNAAPGTIVTDTLPALATLVYASRSATLAGGVLAWPGVTLDVGASLYDTVRVRAPPDTTTLLNIAAATSARFDSNVADNNGSQAASRVSTALKIPDLTITKTHTGYFTVGANGTYAITVSNIGTGPALSVVVTDTLPAGLTFVSAAATAGSWTFSTAGQVVTATLTSPLTAAASASFGLSVLPGATAIPSVTNTAHVTGAREKALSNNFATDLADVRSADLTVTKTSPSFTQGSNGVYTLTVQNVGNGPTTGDITVRDSLANGLTYVGSAGVSGSWSFGNSGQIVTATHAGSLAPSETASFTITVLPGPEAYPSVDNIAVVSGGSQLILANDTARLTTSLAGAADLTMSKAASPTPFVYGANGTYTISVTNVGAIATSGNITVADTLPAGLTFVSGTGSGWSFTSSVVTGGRTLVTAVYSGSSLAALTGTTNFSVTVLVMSTAASVTNTGWVSGGGDGSPDNNSGSVTNAVTARSDLTIEKRSPPGFTQGLNAAYTIVVRNAGSAASSGTITVRDTLPAGVSYVSTAAVVGSWSFAQSANAVTGTTAGVLQSGDSAVFSITVTPLAAGIPSVTNKAVVSNPDQVNLANDTAYVTTPVGGQVDLTIAKTSSEFTEYTQGSYTITIGNSGSVPSAGQITVVDTLAAGITFVSGAGAGWTVDTVGQVVTATHAGSIAVGGSSAFTLTVMVGNVPASVVNTARVSGGGDSNTANNLATVTTPVVQLPDLTVMKSSSTFAVGQTGATYTLVVSNIGSAATTSPMTLVDTLPTGVEFVSIGNGWTGSYDAGGRVLTATRTNTLAAGSTTSLVITVSITAAALPSVTNTAWVSGGGEASTGNNNGSVTTSVAAPDLTVSKVSSASFVVGAVNDKGYRFTVTNIGNGAIFAGTLITVTDTLPAGVTAVAKDGSGDWTVSYDAGTRIMTATHTKAVAAGTSTQTLQLDVTFGAGTQPSVTNTAHVSTPGEADNANNSSSVTTPVSGADLAIAKTSSALFTPETAGSYTLSVTNVGSTGTSGSYSIVDTLPAHLTLATVMTPQDGWTVGVATIAGRAVVTATRSTILSAGASSSFTLNPTVLVAAMPSVYNKAYLSGGGQLASPENDTASVVTPVASPDLTLAKVATGVFEVTGTAAYTLTVTNTGNYVTSGSIIVTDTLPAGLGYRADGTAGTGWTFSNTGQVVTATHAGTLAPGAASSFTIGVSIGEAAAPNVTNVARVSGGNDQNPANNAGGPVTTLVGGQADLSIEKAATTPGFTYDAAGSYTIKVTNVGTLPTSGSIIVKDTLAAGLTFVSGSGTGWTVSETGGVVTATTPGPIAAGGSTSISLNVIVGVAGESVVNVARVSGGGDSNFANDSSRAITPILAPDLTVVKLALGTFRTGATATYRITARNVGTAPSSANIIVTDTLPAGLTYVSGAGTGWTVSATGQVVTATYDGAALAANGDSAYFVLTVGVGEAAFPQVVNTAWISGGGEYSTENNKAGPVTTSVGGQPDLTIAKAAAGAFERGGNAAYTITVTNIGAVQTSGSITVTDTLESSLTFVSIAGTGWTANAAGQVVTATYNGDAIAANGSTSFTLTVAISVTAGTSVTNSARVAGGGEFNESNNGSGPVTVSLHGAPNITVVKSVLPAATVVPGSLLTYSIAFLNGGTAPAVNVVVTDDLPAQVQLKIGSISQSYPAGIVAVTEYYNGSEWTYVPVSGGCGAPADHDGCVTRVRWSLQSPMPQATQGTISLQARVK